MAVSMYLLFTGCAGKPGDPIAGTGTSTQTGLAGILYKENWRSSAGAVIRCIKTDSIGLPKLGKASLLTIDSTLADSSGTFLFERLPDGQYGIIGSQGDDACFQDSIQVVHGNGEAKPDTIRPTGAISGIVRLQAGDDSRTVLILIYGINSFSVPTDFIGDFSLSEIPYGTYRVPVSCRRLRGISPMTQPSRL